MTSAYIGEQGKLVPGAYLDVSLEEGAGNDEMLDFDGKPVTLVMGKQNRAVDNLRVLYLAVEAMRLNEKRDISDVIESAYLQLAAPMQEKDPYEILEIRPDASLEVAESVYKAKVRNIHPDRGGSTEHMKVLNQAIDEVRKKFK